MKKLFINISRWYKLHDYYDIAYKNLFLEKGINTVIFFDKKLSTELNIDNNTGYKILFYKSEIDLINQINLLNKECIYYINTFEEVLIPLVHKIRIDLWLEVSWKYDSFRKKHLQRDILAKTFPETTVKFFEVNIEKDSIENYYNKLNFPYIIKPSSWVQSSWVSIINNKEDLKTYVKNAKFLNENMISRWIYNEVFLLEEFIDWEMYTIVYFVDNNKNISYTPVVKVNWAKKIWIDDFFNYVRINWKIVDSELSNEDLKIFIEKTVEAFDIKNTFIFQDFKKNSSWVLKNIELNARIWWYRLEIFQNLYNFNLLEMPLMENIELTSDSSNAVFVFYPHEKWILDWLNIDLLEKFKKLKSFISIRFSQNKVGLEVWPTKDWFWSIAAIRLNNKNLEQFISDYDFIEKNYKNLIILK